MTATGARWVLVVDDSENAAATLEIALMGIPGLSVRLASSGLEALGVLDRQGHAAHAIVTDLNMPRMDGYELIRRLRQDRRYCATPIIVVSADTDPATSKRVAALGVAAYFSKTYSPAEVRRKVEQILDDKVQ
jgi:two-component system, chemotaxis family, chemotaxis protein CheY